MGAIVIPAGQENDPNYYVPPYDRSIELQPNFFCRARNVKREKYCRARSGQGTDHLGQGRCKNHGGSVPITHGRYSEVTRDSLGEHIERLELEDEKDKLDILPEATMLRGIVLESLEKWKEYRDAMIAWNAAEQDESQAEERRPKFMRVPELSELGDMVKKTAEIVNMVHKQRSANAISMTDFLKLMGIMAETVVKMTEKHLKNRIPQQKIDEFLDDLQKEWRSIKMKK